MSSPQARGAHLPALFAFVAGAATVVIVSATLGTEPLEWKSSAPRESVSEQAPRLAMPAYTPAPAAPAPERQGAVVPPAPQAVAPEATAAVNTRIETVSSSVKTYTRAATDGGLVTIDPIRTSSAVLSAATATRFEFQQRQTVSGKNTLVTVFDIKLDGDTRAPARAYPLAQQTQIDAVKVTCANPGCRYLLIVVGE